MLLKVKIHSHKEHDGMSIWNYLLENNLAQNIESSKKMITGDFVLTDEECNKFMNSLVRLKRYFPCTIDVEIG